MCHPAPVQLHYLAAGTQTGGSHSLGLFISETLSFWGPKASASTSVRGRGGRRRGGERRQRHAEWKKMETERACRRGEKRENRQIWEGDKRHSGVRGTK